MIIKYHVVIGRGLVFRPFYVGEVVKLIDVLNVDDISIRDKYIGKEYIVCELIDRDNTSIPVFNLAGNHPDKRIFFNQRVVVERAIKIKKLRSYIHV